VSTNSYGLIIEGLVAALLMLTIGYCMILNRRLSRLRNDENSFKGTIAELVASTENAERAIAGLKLTVRESEEVLASRLHASEKVCGDLQRELKRGEGVLTRIVKIAEAADGARTNQSEPVLVAEVPAVQALSSEALIRRRAAETAATAQALAARSRLRAERAA